MGTLVKNMGSVLLIDNKEIREMLYSQNETLLNVETLKKKLK